MMETLQVENKAAVSPQLLTKTSRRHKAPKVGDQNTAKSFYQKSLLIGNYYTFVEDDVNNEQKIIGLILFHDLTDFLLWVHQPIVAIFGDVEKTLHLSKCWDEDEYHLVLTICSGLEDMDELTRLEDKLFDVLENYDGIGHALHYIVIAQD